MLDRTLNDSFIFLLRIREHLEVFSGETGAGKGAERAVLALLGVIIGQACYACFDVERRIYNNDQLIHRVREFGFVLMMFVSLRAVFVWTSRGAGRIAAYEVTYLCQCRLFRECSMDYFGIELRIEDRPSTINRVKRLLGCQGRPSEIGAYASKRGLAGS